MSDIPTDLFREILLRLPAVPLLRFRCVCTAWRYMIDDPGFIKSHIRLQTTRGDKQLIMRDTSGAKLYTIPLECLISSYFVGNKIVEAVPLETLDRLTSTSLPRPLIFPLDSSCHGLVLLHHYKVDEVWAVWNPFTREFRELPAYNDLTRAKHVYYGALGYDETSDDYKIVRLAPIVNIRNRSLKVETLVCSLKLNYWRRIEDFPSCFWPTGGHGAYLNGVLHWTNIVSKPTGEQAISIVAFNLEAENYRLLPLPSSQELHWHNKQDVGVLGGCLILSLFNLREQMDVWIMNDYGVESSWTKLLSITRLVDRGLKWPMRTIAYLKHENLVLIQHSVSEFLWFDVDKKSAKKVTFVDVGDHFTFRVSLANLFRLNKPGAGQYIDAKGIESDKTNLKLSLTTSGVWRSQY